MAPALPTVVSQRPQPASVAKAAAQRYLNRASGRMETAQQIHTYHPPPSRPVPPVGHQTSNTTRTVTRTVTPAVKAPVSFINKSPAEVEATARQLTNAEVSGIRGAYQPANQLLGQEQTGALGAHATSYGQLGATVGNLQTQQAESAKTFENYAADAINSAATAAPGAAQTAERLGLKPGEKAPESAERQQEAARTLLSGIAQGGAAGTNARQQNEANFLTNMQGTAALGNAEGAKAIEGQYALQKGKVGEKEQAAIAKAEGNTATLGQKLFGEQEKDRIAAAGLGYKEAAATSKIRSERNKEGEGKIKLSQAQEKLAQAGKKLGLEEQYKLGTLSEKRYLDENNVKYKEGTLREIGRKNKIAEEKAGPGGTKVTAAQKAGYEKEMLYALAAFETGPNNRGGGKDYQAIRKSLAGKEKVIELGGKEKAVKGGSKVAVNPVVLNAMEQVFRYHYVNPETKTALAALGLPSEGLSNLLLRG